MKSLRSPEMISYASSKLRCFLARLSSSLPTPLWRTVSDYITSQGTLELGKAGAFGLRRCRWLCPTGVITRYQEPGLWEVLARTTVISHFGLRLLPVTGTLGSDVVCRWSCVNFVLMASTIATQPWASQDGVKLSGVKALLTRESSHCTV